MLVGENIIFGGKADEKTLKIEPTLVDQVKYDNVLMQEEIFGPIFEYEELDSVISFINSRSKPLVLYFFSKDKIKQTKVEQRFVIVFLKIV